MKKKISVYTKDGITGSSSYYRIIQYFSSDVFKNVKLNFFVPTWLTKAQYNNVKSKNIKSLIVKILYHLFVIFNSIKCFIGDIINKPETVVILRGIESKTFFWPISLLYKKVVSECKNVIWDFDDDIFINHEITLKEKELLEHYSHHIIVTHKDLASLLSKDVQDKIMLLPTTDGSFENYNLDIVNKDRMKSYDTSFKIVWVTSSSGFTDIPKIELALDEAAKQLKEKYNKDLELVVVCNKPYDKKFDYLKVRNYKWTREIAINEILKSHLGIMPLKNSQFSIGKGGFKLVQYMAAGLPNIGSSVGYNKTVIKNNFSGFLIEDEKTQKMWVDKIILLATNKEEWHKMSIESKKRWEELYSFKDNLSKWNSIINEK